MHKDRNNNSWSELKAKKNHSEFDDAPLRAKNIIQADLIGAEYDSRKEKNDRSAKQLDSVTNMFKDMADYDLKQNKLIQKST